MTSWIAQEKAKFDALAQNLNNDTKNVYDQIEVGIVNLIFHVNFTFCGLFLS